MRPVIGVLLLMLLVGCHKRENTVLQTYAEPEVTKLGYAEGFRVERVGDARLVEVTYPYQGATEGYRYLLVPRGHAVPEHDASTKVIYTPVRSIACTSTTHVPMLDYLGHSDKLTAFTSTDYISTPAVRARIDQGKVTELGIDKGINLERLALAKPDLLMGYSISSDYAQFRKIEQLGIPVVINAEYLEKHPLGRAEWIKFVALFFDEEKAADSIFNHIEKNYLEAAHLAANVATRPMVLSGVVYGDAWFLPGGQNYAARLLKDAGCAYVWENDASHGFLELSFEAVYEKAHNADLWIGIGAYTSRAAIEAADRRYAKFKPFQTKQLYTSDARKGAKGGSEYLELGYLRPDIILKDLIKIGHPALLPGHALYFHRQLTD